MVLELRDKVKKINIEHVHTGSPLLSGIHEDALQALTSLGIGRNMAEQALKKITIEPGHQNLPLEELIKKALKAI